ncbi:MAG: PSD1 and planctomycete cytochrome C domain-containing protein [Pirellulales bacterium]
MSQTKLLIASLGCLCVCLCAQGAEPETPAATRTSAPPADAIEHFEKHIRPLLAARCWKCHGDEKQEASLRLDTAAGVTAGGDSGPPIVPGDPEHSPMISAVRYQDEPKMPPDGRLNEQEVATLVAWVKRGAPWPKDLDDDAAKLDASAAEQLLSAPAPTNGPDPLWAFRPLANVEPPPLRPGEPESKSPIDRFIERELDRQGLSAAPPADKRTLARRAYFDLLGLPPSIEEIEAFVNDPAEDAFARLIDKLLASPHYGERWARHWLDVARYADSGGYETDMYFRNAWRYRDYVVKSFNDDKPYDRFVQEQIAGDEIWPDDLGLPGSYVMPKAKLEHLEARIATGLYTLGPQIHESNMDAALLDYERLTDWADTTGSVFLGLTLGCARCHDHKFDPISQRDYYSLQAVFAGSRETEIPLVNGMEIADFKQHYPRIIAVDEARRAYRQFEKGVAGRKLTAEEEERRRALRDKIAEAVLELPESAASTPNDRFDGLMEVPTASVLAHVNPPLVPAVHVLGRGDLDRPKRRVGPDLPAVLRAATNYREPLAPGITTRKQLAEWLTSPAHPLTWRVMVNRIWQWHFGAGLVATPNDFGKMGAAPSHKELLDWLAQRFVGQGFSIKQMHREIMLSQAYRRASQYSPLHNLQQDADNKLLWRANRQRLEAESLWDYIHATSGTLNLALGGRPVVPPLAEDELSALRERWQWTVSADPREHTRRGLYVLVRRNFRFPMFEVFDSPINAVSSPRRDVTIVAPQTLWSLNNRRAWDQAQQFAARLVREVGTDPSACVDRAWKLALSRVPSDTEKAEAVQLMSALVDEHQAAAGGSPPLVNPPAALAKLPPGQAAALSKLCLALFNLNEFLFID